MIDRCREDRELTVAEVCNLDDAGLLRPLQVRRRDDLPERPVRLDPVLVLVTGDVRDDAAVVAEQRLDLRPQMDARSRRAQRPEGWWPKTRTSSRRTVAIVSCVVSQRYWASSMFPELELSAAVSRTMKRTPEAGANE